MAMEPAAPRRLAKYCIADSSLNSACAGGVSAQRLLPTTSVLHTSPWKCGCAPASGGEMDSYPGEEDAQWQYEEAQRQNEEAQRQNCDEQVEILSQIEAELAAGTQPASQSLPHSHHRSTWPTCNIYQARRTRG